MHVSARNTPATMRNATVEMTTPARLTARLSSRLVPADAEAARRARTIHIEHQRKRGGGREGPWPPPRPVDARSGDHDRMRRAVLLALGVRHREGHRVRTRRRPRVA